MARSDAIRWNQRYSINENIPALPSSFLVNNLNFLPVNGKVLDVAMGNGRNSIFLSDNGYSVVGIDISIVALKQIRSRRPSMGLILADLDNLHLAPHSFDVILNFNYLQRSLFHQFSNLLNTGGVILIETLLYSMREINPNIPTAYLLEKGELLEIFSGWDILSYHEGWVPSDHGKRKAVASLAARLP